MTSPRAGERVRARQVGALAFMLLATSVVLPSLVGLLSVEITRDLRIGDVRLGMAISAFWGVSAIAAPLAGRWVDRRGWRLGAVVGAVLAGGALLASATLVSAWFGLTIALAVAGLAYGFASPTSNLAVVASVRRGRMAGVLGMKQTAPPVLMATAGVVVPFLADLFGWRSALAAGVLLPVVVLVGLGRFGCAGPEHGSDAGHVGAGVDVRDRVPDRGWIPSGSRVRGPAGLRTVSIVTAAGLGTFSVATMTGFAVLTLVSVGLPPSGAAGVVSAGSVLAVVARVLFGRFLDRRPVGDLGPLLVVMAVASGALFLVSAGILGFGAPGGATRDVAAVAVVAGVIAGLVAAWTWPALLLLMVVRGSSSPGAASGLLQLGSGIGAASGPLAFGLLSAAGGRGVGWLCMGGATVAAFCLVRRVRHVRPPGEGVAPLAI